MFKSLQLIAIPQVVSDALLEIRKEHSKKSTPPNAKTTGNPNAKASSQRQGKPDGKVAIDLESALEKDLRQETLRKANDTHPSSSGSTFPPSGEEKAEKVETSTNQSTGKIPS